MLSTFPSACTPSDGQQVAKHLLRCTVWLRSVLDGDSMYSSQLSRGHALKEFGPGKIRLCHPRSHTSVVELDRHQADGDTTDAVSAERRYCDSILPHRRGTLHQIDPLDMARSQLPHHLEGAVGGVVVAYPYPGLWVVSQKWIQPLQRISRLHAGRQSRKNRSICTSLTIRLAAPVQTSCSLRLVPRARSPAPAKKSLT